MNSEIAILFIRFAIKHSFQKNILLHLPVKTCQKESSFLRKKLQILEARISEIAILFVRFAIKHSFHKNSLLHCLPKRILVLEKRIPYSYDKSFWTDCNSIHKICNYTFFPEELSTSLLAGKNSRSWEKNSRFLWREFLKSRFFLGYSVVVPSYQKNSLLFDVVSRTSILLERIEIKWFFW